MLGVLDRAIEGCNPSARPESAPLCNEEEHVHC